MFNMLDYYCGYPVKMRLWTTCHLWKHLALENFASGLIMDPLASGTATEKCSIKQTLEPSKHIND